MTQNETKKEWTLNRKFLAAFFILLVIDFIFYKFFGETRTGPPTLGWYVFLITTIFCGLSVIGWVATFIQEFVSSCMKKRKKNKRNGNST